MLARAFSMLRRANTGLQSGYFSLPGGSRRRSQSTPATAAANQNASEIGLNGVLYKALIFCVAIFFIGAVGRSGDGVVGAVGGSSSSGGGIPNNNNNNDNNNTTTTSVPKIAAFVPESSPATTSSWWSGYAQLAITFVCAEIVVSIATLLPSISDVVHVHYGRPYAVYVEIYGPLYDALESYIVERFRPLIRSCQLMPRNNLSIDLSLKDVELTRPIVDEFEGHVVLLQTLTVNSEGNTVLGGYGSRAFEQWHRMYASIRAWLRGDLQTAADTAAVKPATEKFVSAHCSRYGGSAYSPTTLIGISSWTLSADGLRRFVLDRAYNRVGKTRKLRLFCAIPDISSSSSSSSKSDASGGGVGGDGTKTSVRQQFLPLRWRETQKYTSKRIKNTIVSRAVERDVFADIQLFTTQAEWYNRVGIAYQRGYVLYGPPGSGKTSILKALAADYNWDIFKIDGGNIVNSAQLSDVLGEISSHVAEDHMYILAFEDLDRCTALVNSNDSAALLSVLLNELDGIDEPHSRIIFITANDFETLRKIDPSGALLRPGRIDKCVCVDLCDADQMKRMFAHFYAEKFAENETTTTTTTQPQMHDIERKIDNIYSVYATVVGSGGGKKTTQPLSPAEVLRHIKQSPFDPETAIDSLVASLAPPPLSTTTTTNQ